MTREEEENMMHLNQHLIKENLDLKVRLQVLHKQLLDLKPRLQKELKYRYVDGVRTAYFE